LADTGLHDPDRELFGQGLANLVTPLFGGMPATGAIARTAVNVRAGARTRVAAIVHAFMLVGVVYFGGSLVAKIPLAALAGVLAATGAQALGQIVEQLERRGITVLLKGPRPEHVKVLDAVGALDRLAHENHLFADLDAAIAHAQLHVARLPAG